MSETLRELVAQTTTVENMLIDSAGEITPEIEALLSDIDTKLPAKIDGYQFTLDRLKKVGEFYQERADQMQRYADAANKLQERLKENIKFAMLEMGKDEICGVDHRFIIARAHASVIIANEDDVPDSYKKVKQTITVDKKRIAEDLKIGVPVKGCSLEFKPSIRSVAARVK